MKLFGLILILFINACGEPDGLDLSRYVTSLADSSENSAPYLDRIVSDKCDAGSKTSVVPCEVKKISEFFSDKQQAKQLLLPTRPGSLKVDPRVRALAKSGMRVNQIHVDVLEKDVARGTLEAESFPTLLQTILDRKCSGDSICYLNLEEKFPKSVDLTQANLILVDSSSGKNNFEFATRFPLGFISLPELALYVQPQKVALLSFVLLSHHDVLSVALRVENSIGKFQFSNDGILDSAMAEFMAVHPNNGIGFDVRQKMKSVLVDDDFTYAASYFEDVSKVVSDHYAHYTSVDSEHYELLVTAITRIPSNIFKSFKR